MTRPTMVQRTFLPLGNSMSMGLPTLKPSSSGSFWLSSRAWPSCGSSPRPDTRLGWNIWVSLGMPRNAIRWLSEFGSPASDCVCAVNPVHISTRSTLGRALNNNQRNDAEPAPDLGDRLNEGMLRAHHHDEDGAGGDQHRFGERHPSHPAEGVAQSQHGHPGQALNSAQGTIDPSLAV